MDAPAKETPQGFLELEVGKPVLWAGIFGGEAPVEVEIGCGKAAYLFARAVENPGVNFLGIDKSMKWMKRKQKRSESEHVQNVKFAKADAREVARNIPDGSVRIFHIYCPDPWPKRRHRVRRIISVQFLELLYKKLEAGGIIYLATDDADYFEHMQRDSAAMKSPRTVRTSLERMIGPVKTNYEIKWEAAGRRMQYMEIKKP